MKPRSLTLTRVRVEAGNAASSGRRPTDTSTRSNSCSLSVLTPSPSNVTRMPLGSAFICVDACVQQHRLHQRADRAWRARRRDRDRRRAAGPPVISTTVTALPSVGVDRAELEADVAAADDEQRLRDVGQVERGRSSPSRADRPRCSIGGIAGVEPVARIACSKLQRLLAAGRLARSAACADRRSSARPWMYCTLRCLTSWPVPLVSRLTTLFLNSRSLSRSIFGSPNSTPHAFACRDFVDQLGDVQQRLRRDAAAVDADAARVQLRGRRARRSRPRSAARNAAA